MSRGGAIFASLLATIGRPAWWLLALAGFLVRGGFIAFVLPIILLPSPLAISNAVGPFIIPLALGRIGLDVVAVAGSSIFLFLGWLLVGGWIAAATDLALIREQAVAAAEEGVGPGGDAALLDRGGRRSVARPDRVLIRRMLAARLTAWLPLGVAVGVAIDRIVAISYVELTRPSEAATPLVLRVASAATPELIVVTVAWLSGELVGGLAARRIAIYGEPTRRALVGAAADVIRRPVSAVVPWLLATVLLIAVLAASLAAAGLAWAQVMVALTGTLDPARVTLNLLLFVAIWLAALDLAGLCAAARGSVQTFADLRERIATGTFGASAHHRPGDWSVPDEGGSL